MGSVRVPLPGKTKRCRSRISACSLKVKVMFRDQTQRTGGGGGGGGSVILGWLLLLSLSKEQKFEMLFISLKVKYIINTL